MFESSRRLISLRHAGVFFFTFQALAQAGPIRIVSNVFISPVAHNKVFRSNAMASRSGLFH